MTTRLTEVDAVLIGVGLVGTMLGRELTRAGLKVVGLERGNPQFTVPDFQGPHMHDELRYSVRKGFMQDNTKETLTFRNTIDQVGAADPALGKLLAGHRPGRRGGALERPDLPLPGYRFPAAHAALSSATARISCDPDLTIQDWGVTAAELEPHYDRFEYLLGTSGMAGNLKGQKIAGGNPFEDARSRGYPTPPMKEPYGSAHLPQGGGQPRLPSFPAAVVQSEPALHQP